MLKRALLNGKDLNMDTDFLKELGALSGTFEAFGSYGTYHRIGFDTPEGRFCAFWDELDNNLRICCEGLKLFIDEALEMKRLNTLEMRLLDISLDKEVIVRHCILKGEGEHTILKVSFFFK